jgi:asparagine synthase (glutamine-hydrolysing)
VADLWWRSRQIIADADVPHLTGRPAPAVSPMPKDASTFDEVRYHEFKHFLIRQLLQEADTFTMCQSLELRTPFVDHHLVRASVQAGRWRRAPGLSFKATLFQHLDGLRMPDAIARRKQGFVLPYDAWIRSALSTSADGCLSDLRSRLDQDRYRPLVDRYLAGQLHWSAIWALYVLERVSTRAFRFAEPRVASV